MRRLAKFAQDARGQATVELMFMLPIILAIAAVVINAITFFGIAASFDRAFPQAVRVCAQAPGYEGAASSAAARIQAILAERFAGDDCSVEVTVQGDSLGEQTYTGVVRYVPTLFGFSLRQSVFGMDFPELSHGRAITISPFRPGVLI